MEQQQPTMQEVEAHMHQVHAQIAAVQAQMRATALAGHAHFQRMNEPNQPQYQYDLDGHHENNEYNRQLGAARTLQLNTMDQFEITLHHLGVELQQLQSLDNNLKARFVGGGLLPGAHQDFAQMMHPFFVPPPPRPVPHSNPLIFDRSHDWSGFHPQTHFVPHRRATPFS